MEMVGHAYTGRTVICFELNQDSVENLKRNMLTSNGEKMTVAIAYAITSNTIHSSAVIIQEQNKKPRF